MSRIFFAFVVGGLLGVLLAAVLEAALIGSNNPFQFILVGLIEELVKLVALFVVAQRLPRYTTRDGIVLGATVGFGFAALESSGYAFNSLITPHGLSLLGLTFSVVLRGALAPLGHGLWTAVLGGFLFHASERRNRLRPSWALLGMFFAVAGLHALWDSSGGIATAVAGGAADVVIVVSYGVTLFTGALGVAVLLATWFGLLRRPRSSTAAAQMPIWAPPSPSMAAPPPGARPAPPPGYAPPGYGAPPPGYGAPPGYPPPPGYGAPPAPAGGMSSPASSSGDPPAGRPAESNPPEQR
jgi:RsiW-degrading membrane proteinase PrsW (M82 family)